MTHAHEDEEEKVPLRLHIHINEPWAFEQENGFTSVIGTTLDHLDPELDDWDVELEQPFLLYEESYDRVLVSPRYIGEVLNRVVDDFVTAAVRIAIIERNEWHYKMTGTLAHQRDEKKV